MITPNKEKVIARSSRADGLLPMKQSKALEKNKSTKQHTEELCNFIKNAFVVDGDVFLTKDISVFKVDEKIIRGSVFHVNDKKRGTFFVSLTKQIGL